MGLPNLVGGGVFQVLFHDSKLLPEFELNWDISRIILDRTGEGMNAFMLDEVDFAPRLKSNWPGHLLDLLRWRLQDGYSKAAQRGEIRVSKKTTRHPEGASAEPWEEHDPSLFVIVHHHFLRKCRALKTTRLSHINVRDQGAKSVDRAMMKTSENPNETR